MRFCWLILGFMLGVLPAAASAAALKPGDVFKDCPDCPEMVVIPAGSFMMGFDQPPDLIVDSEFVFTTPVHRVTIARPFAMGRYEVTRGAFIACRAAGLCQLNSYMERYHFRPDMPAVNLTFNEKLGFLHWLLLQTGHKYRLPSEAEWEYAARGGTTTRYWWGDKMEPGRENCSDKTKPGWYRKIEPVGQYPPNPFGLYDMMCNVVESVSDCWNISYDGAPTDGTPWLEGRCEWGNSRGASYSSRFFDHPVHDRGWDHYFTTSQTSGFRVVRDLTDAELGLVEDHQTP
ncbi:formylglycine-generating enzyme family protein [Magnetospira thiophila]